MHHIFCDSVNVIEQYTPKCTDIIRHQPVQFLTICAELKVFKKKTVDGLIIPTMCSRKIPPNFGIMVHMIQRNHAFNKQHSLQAG